MCEKLIGSKIIHQGSQKTGVPLLPNISSPVNNASYIRTFDCGLKTATLIVQMISHLLMTYQQTQT